MNCKSEQNSLFIVYVLLKYYPFIWRDLNRFESSLWTVQTKVQTFLNQSLQIFFIQYYSRIKFSFRMEFAKTNIKLHKNSFSLFSLLLLYRKRKRNLLKNNYRKPMNK